MAFGKQVKTEHGGAKNSSAKSGFWGLRIDAKEYSKKIRRRRDKEAIKEQNEN